MANPSPVSRLNVPVAGHLSRLVLTLLLAGTVTTVSVSAEARGTIRQGRSWGIGLTGATVGGVGLSFKTFVSRRVAVQAYAGGDPSGRTLAGHVGADLLLELPRLTRGRVLVLAWNLGVGTATTLSQPAQTWIHGVVGLEVLLKPLPVDIVFEWRPSTTFKRGVSIGMASGSTHVRWWF